MNTNTREILKREIKEIPDDMLEELYRFIKYLKSREKVYRDKMEITYASEGALAKDWNRPEEDEAWKDL